MPSDNALSLYNMVRARMDAALKPFLFQPTNETVLREIERLMDQSVRGFLEIPPEEDVTFVENITLDPTGTLLNATLRIPQWAVPRIKYEPPAMRNRRMQGFVFEEDVEVSFDILPDGSVGNWSPRVVDLPL